MRSGQNIFNARNLLDAAQAFRWAVANQAQRSGRCRHEDPHTGDTHRGSQMG